MKKLIEQPFNQRLIYFSIFLLWIFFGLNFVQYKNDSPSLKIDIQYFIIFPTLILFIPIFYIKKFTWFLTFSFSLFYTIWTSLKIIVDNLKNISQLPIENKAFDYVISLLIVTILITISYLIFKIKPKNSF